MMYVELFMDNGIWYGGCRVKTPLLDISQIWRPIWRVPWGTLHIDFQIWQKRSSHIIRLSYIYFFWITLTLFCTFDLTKEVRIYFVFHTYIFGGHTCFWGSYISGGHTYILGGHPFFFPSLCAFIKCSCSNSMGNFKLISNVYEHVCLVLNFMLEFPYCLSNTNFSC